MNKEDLIKIEDVLDVKLPLEYKEIMLNYPFKENEDEIGKRYLLNDADKIIEINQKLRKEGYKKKKKWPNHFYVIGEVTDNNYYFLNLLNGKEVYFIDEERRINLENFKKLIISIDLKQFIQFSKDMHEVVINP